MVELSKKGFRFCSVSKGPPILFCTQDTKILYPKEDMILLYDEYHNSGYFLN